MPSDSHTARAGWKLRLDRVRPDDTAYDQDGRDVLIVDAAVGKAMASRILDVISTEAGARLKLRRLNRGSD